MSLILFSRENQTAVLTLNRPDKFNSFNRDMALELQGYLDECAAEEEIRAVVLTGSGKAFCAGQDLAEATDPQGPPLEQIVSDHYNPIILKIRNLEKPVIAAVNGVAAGAGANIALACDIVLAKESASFIQAFSKIGLIPDSAGTYFLPRLVGMQRATALMMTGDKLSATEAFQMGMIYRVYPDESFEKETMTLASQLASMPTRGLALTKKLLNETYQHTLEQQLAREKDLQVQAGNTYDFKEGVAAFLEKRAPVFKGK
jgi:2-(1,2-epoxy-1,2-dihydrophenyl)acetyl-CoA isomerase